MANTSNPVVGIDVEMKVANALSELKRLSPGADKEAKAIAASLGKSLKDVERQAKSASDKLAAGMGKAGDQISKTAKALGPLGGVLSRISPEAGAAASSIAAMTSAAEGFGEAGLAGVSLGAAAGLAVVATALAVGTVAWVAYNDETAKAAEIAGLVEAAEKRLVPMIEATRMAQIDAADATGQMNAEAAKLERIGVASMRAYQSATKDTAAEIRVLQDSHTSMMGQVSHGLADVVEWAQGFTAVQVASMGTVNALAAVTESSSETDAKIAALSGVMTHAITVAKDGAEAHRASAAATRGHAAAAKDLASEVLALSAAGQREADAFSARLAGIESASDQADALVAKSGEFRLDEIAKLRAAEDAAVNDYVAKARDGAQSIAQIAAGEAAIRGAYDEQVADAQAQSREKRIAAEVAAVAAIADAQRQSVDAAIGNINQVGGYAQQALGMLDAAASASYEHSSEVAQSLTEQLIAGDKYYTAAQKKELEARIAASKTAARKQFAAAKAAKVAEAMASTALAAINAIAQSPPPSPFGLIGAGIATAAGVAAVSEISSQTPSFHKGYAPDEMDAKVLKKESVLTPAATAALGGPRAAKEMNAGVTKSQAPSSPVIVYRHQEFRPFIRDFMTQRNAITDYANRGKITGHRTNRRGTSG